MANLLTLRTQPGASILKLDAAFFRESVRPLLDKRGFVGDLFVDVDAAGLERLFTGKQVVPAAGRLSATAGAWRSLLFAATAREQASGKGARDIGGQTALAGQSKDWVRQKNGRRVKSRPNTRSLKIAAPATATAPSSSVTDPAAFAVQNLARLAALVVDAVKDAAEDAVVEVAAGSIVVGGKVVRLAAD